MKARILPWLLLGVAGVMWGCGGRDFPGGPPENDGGSVPDAAPPDPSGRVPARHRPTAAACDSNRPASTSSFGGGGGVCATDADCTDGINGRCGASGRVIGCTYDDCFTDSDCSGDKGGGVCGCRGDQVDGANVCLTSGNCHVDADCGPGGYCSPSLGSCGTYAGVEGYYCHTASDECIDDTDCPTQPGLAPAYCAFMPDTGRWQCSSSLCAG
jgi:hypothetical protein